MTEIIAGGMYFKWFGHEAYMNTESVPSTDVVCVRAFSSNEIHGFWLSHSYQVSSISSEYIDRSVWFVIAVLVAKPSYSCVSC